MFAGNNYIHISEKVHKIYTDQFLEQIYNRLKIKKNKRAKFKKCIIDSAINYLNAIEINSKRITPTKQNKILTDYADALEEVQRQYKNVQKHITTGGKLGKSLKRAASKTNEPSMKDMLYPYVDETGIAITLFDDFLGLLVTAARQAPEEKIGNDKKTIEGKFIAFWVACIRLGWSACSDAPFEHGKTYKELGGETINPCPEILCQLFEKISPNTPPSRVKTALRKVIKTDIDEPVANFIIQ